MRRLSLAAIILLCLLVNKISAFKLTSRRLRLGRTPSTAYCLFAADEKATTDIETYEIKSGFSDGMKYYKGLINDPITDLQVNPETAATRDNLTPNLRLGAIFVIILAVLGEAFIYVNKDIPPPPY